MGNYYSVVYVELKILMLGCTNVNFVTHFNYPFTTFDFPLTQISSKAPNRFGHRSLVHEPHLLEKVEDVFDNLLCMVHIMY